MSEQALKSPASPRPQVILPAVPIVTVSAKEAALLTTEGEVKLLPHGKARAEIGTSPVMVCHAPYAKTRLGMDTLNAFDILELFAFVHPARFCVPTPAGLAKALDLSAPESFEDYPFTLMEAAQALLTDLQDEPRTGPKTDPLEVARVMGREGQGWPWTPFVFSALGETYDPAVPALSKPSLNIWKYLPEWAEEAPEPPPAHHPVTKEESRERLSQLLDASSEARPQQVEYAEDVTEAFLPPEPAISEEELSPPHIVLAEAGTGTGKTLGYLAPASVWAEKNKGSVWISTYTKNLQKQIDGELSRLHPHPDVKAAKVAVRKGRENYLCLLNLEDEVAGAALAKSPKQALAAGLMARWAERTRDGDLTGGDFPGWLVGLLGPARSTALADRRGECVFSACDHYHKCFIERSVRKAQHADIVIANHALVMYQTAMARPGATLPARYVFDEGHHLFEAADSAFSGHLTAWETADLRRWLLGVEGGRKSRARGLKRRAEDLVAGDAEGEKLLEDIIHAAHVLPAQNWSRRFRDNAPNGAAEIFLMQVYAQVFGRAAGREGPYSLETETRPLSEGLLDAAEQLRDKLSDLQKPMRKLAAQLDKKLNDQADTLDSDTRKRLESLSGSLTYRSDNLLGAWISMLETLREQDAPKDFVDWLAIERIDGKARDVGMHRHWVDPMKPFAATIGPHAQGMLITSATLRDGTGDEAEDWRVARERTGAALLADEARNVKQVALPSPYDYADRTRIFVLTDIRKDDMEQVSSATRELFKAAGGGAIGLFTAIARLRAVQRRIAGPLEEADLRLYAQHVDEIDTATLVDIFRDDTHACLLGTDAVRDGVDVPGESLRLLVYDRVPWPRPDILHKARREHFGGRRYDELITRLKLRQAYGRLIRSQTDRGVFVMLDSALPTRLHGAFPENVPVQRVGLAEAIEEIKGFLA